MTIHFLMCARFSRFGSNRLSTCGSVKFQCSRSWRATAPRPRPQTVGSLSRPTGASYVLGKMKANGIALTLAGNSEAGRAGEQATAAAVTVTKDGRRQSGRLGRTGMPVEGPATGMPAGGPATGQGGMPANPQGVGTRLRPINVIGRLMRLSLLKLQSQVGRLVPRAQMIRGPAAATPATIPAVQRASQQRQRLRPKAPYLKGLWRWTSPSRAPILTRL